MDHYRCRDNVSYKEAIILALIIAFVIAIITRL